MNHKYKIAVWVCAKNEEKVIEGCLNTILLNLQNIDYDRELYICINGSKDSTEEIVSKWISDRPEVGAQISLIVLSEPNLIEAQRVIWDRAQEVKYDSVVFIDADTQLDKDCIYHLVETLKNNDEVKVSYAVSHPLHSDNTTFVEKVLNNYDSSNAQVFSARRHLHGRVFATKDWNIPVTFPKLMTDDIYLSFYYLHTYWVESIRRVDESIVYFQQVKTLNDLYKAYKRRALELQKIRKLFPELYDGLPKESVNRQFSFKAFWKENFEKKILRIALLFFRRFCKLRLKIDNLFSPSLMNQWEDVTSSKLSNNQQQLILIEWLDCSGKKTLAREVIKTMFSDGISSRIHMWPFWPRRYTTLVRLATVNNFPDSVRSLVFSLEPHIHSTRIKQWWVIIQISSVLRSMAYAKVFKKKFRIFLNKLLPIKLIKYDFVYYLTADFEDRKQRHHLQNLVNENSEDIEKRFPSEEIFKKLNHELETRLKANYANTAYQCYNTSKEDINKIAQIVVDRVYDKIHHIFIRRNWKNLSAISSDLPVHQVYVWLLDHMNRVVIVSKDGKKWQMPWGKPDAGENVFETWMRETQEETWINISNYMNQLKLFGYYEIKEWRLSKDWAYEIQNYIQARICLKLENIDISERVNVWIQWEDIKYVKKVSLSELGQYIPWMLSRDEFNFIKTQYSDANPHLSA